MRSLLYLLSAFFPVFLFSQQTKDTEFIEEPKYDTVSFDINSTNSFYFCSKLYKIPRDCDKKDQSNCCSFSSQVHVKYNMLNGQLACYDGTSLSWMQFETAEQARSAFEGYPPQIKKQMKKFTSTSIKLFICGQEVQAYQLNSITTQGHKVHEIIAHGTINGQHIRLSLHSQKELSSSKDLREVFQQIVQF